VIRGLAAWALALLLALFLPGSQRHPSLSPFPWEVSIHVVGLLLAMVLIALGLTEWLGSRLGRGRALGFWEGFPDLLWGAMALVLWPSAWGPPGFPALALAFMLAALPGELRWLAQALPAESPIARAWGAEASRLARRTALRRLLPRWLCARLPLWITGTLVLERLLGVRGPGSDWMMRVAARDRVGTCLWLLAFATLWVLLRREDT
jgi:hypothetical protein